MVLDVRFLAVARCLCAAGLGLCLLAQGADRTWTRVRSSHFEVYSQAGADSARAALLWFERLRAFFERSGVKLDDGTPVRVIGFASVREYDAYRLRPTADAYYIGTERRDTIVMPTLDIVEFPVAAHEYAHLVLHASGVQLAPWLSEGLAEYFSTVRISNRECQVGGSIAKYLRILQERRWLPLPQLLTMPEDSAVRQSRAGATLFYAESWALVDMLLESPRYRSRFAESIAELHSSAVDTRVIASDLRAWVNGPKTSPVELPGVVLSGLKIESESLTAFQTRVLLAELLAASGELERAEAAYRELLRESPEDADLHAALGAIALRRGDKNGARREWKQALDEGVTDASLCYRYAELADEAGVLGCGDTAGVRAGCPIETGF